MKPKKNRHPKNGNAAIVYWHQLAEGDERHIVLIGNRVWADGAWSLVILLFVAGWVSFFGFILFASKDAGHFLTVLCVAFMLVPVVFVIWAGSQMPSMFVTRVEFLLPEKVTRLTYFRLWKRQIPALPSSVAINSHPSKINGYTGVASLAYGHRRTRIPLLYTDEWFDLAAEAEERAAAAASDIQRLMQLKETYPKDAVLSVTDRVWSFAGGLFFAGFSSGMFWAAFSSGRINGDPIPFLPDAWNQLIGRALFAIFGAFMAAVAAYYFWGVIRPNRPRK